jgi:hypothetical protein
MEEFMGWNNKIAIMRYDSETDEVTTYILNETAGNKDHGCWFSNYSWKTYKQTTIMNAHSVMGNHHHQGVITGFGSEHHFKQTDYAKQLIEKAEREAAHKKALALKGGDAPKKEDGPGESNVEDFPKDEQLEAYYKSLQGIEVPRDEGVLERIAAKERAYNGLYHLNKKQKKAIGRFATDLCRAFNINGGFETIEKIRWTREKAVDLFEECRAISPIKLDLMLASGAFHVNEFVRKDHEAVMNTY